MSLLASLRWLGSRRHLGLLCGWTCVAAVAAANVIALVWIARYSWAIHRLERGVGDTVFLDAEGKPWFRLDENRNDVPLDRIAPILRQAVIAVEDHRFRDHPGIDAIGFGRALVHNLQARGVVEGGSTLTQQLARTLFLSNRRTAGRKAKEAVLALLLEAQLSKDQILELYLNRVYLGSGRHGVEAMARSAFGRGAADLDLAQAALLAGLIQSPTGYSPWTKPDAARRRAAVVLQRLREEGVIDAARERAARAERLRFGDPPGVTAARGGYPRDWLRAQFADHFGGDHPPDWQVQTTFVPALQDAAERAVTDGLRALHVPDLQAALVAIDPETGDVLAMVGGADARRFPFNRAVRAHRQPGSAFKPLVYALALKNGMSPVSVLTGLSAFEVAGPVDWRPDVGEEPADALNLREALRQSNNAAAAVLQQRVGTRAVRRLADELGLRDLPEVPSLALGTGEVTPLDLTVAYAAFANGGQAVRPRGILAVADEDGELAWDQPVERRKVLPRDVAFQVESLLRDVVDEGTARRLRELGVRFPVAGKTGTTDDYRDAWFVGFSSSIVVGVWVGLDQPATIREDGYASRLALPMWADFMRRAARIRPPREFRVPPEMRAVELCRETFLRPLDDCPTYVEHFKEGDDVPSRSCPVHGGNVRQRAKRGLEEVLEEILRKIGRLGDR
jgi:membrane peptidoglycan carboxypeptidase